MPCVPVPDFDVCTNSVEACLLHSDVNMEVDQAVVEPIMVDQVPFLSLDIDSVLVELAHQHAESSYRRTDAW